MNTATLKKDLYSIIFGTDTKAWRVFDSGLLLLIFLATFIVIMSTVPSYTSLYGHEISVVSVIITVLFAVEYGVRIVVHPNPKEYIISFFGIVDLLALAPLIVEPLGLGWSEAFLIVRSLRLLRLFRVLNLWSYMSASTYLVESIKASRNKIIVFMLSVAIIVIIVWTLMYMIEWAEAGFTSIPMGIYWSIVTITTVWYGDITPATPMGQLLSALLMLLWYAIIAIPTWLVSAEIALSRSKKFHDKHGELDTSE